MKITLASSHGTKAEGKRSTVVVIDRNYDLVNSVLSSELCERGFKEGEETRTRESGCKAKSGDGTLYRQSVGHLDQAQTRLVQCSKTVLYTVVGRRDASFERLHLANSCVFDAATDNVIKRTVENLWDWMSIRHGVNDQL